MDKNLGNDKGSPSGTAAQTSGPSSTYGGRIRGAVEPNITFTTELNGNPTAEVEVRQSPDGTITGSRLVKSSGVKEWDDAVLRAIDKTQKLPRDIDGRVISPFIITFRPNK
jgi:colicin import membrane protein